jgi:hypothetical protein
MTVEAGVRPNSVDFCVPRRSIADFRVAMVTGSGYGAPLTFATLKFQVPQHESYPQALVLGLDWPDRLLPVQARFANGVNAPQP